MSCITERLLAPQEWHRSIYFKLHQWARRRNPFSKYIIFNH